MLKALGLVSLVAAALALIAGITTSFWPTAHGTLERFQHERAQSLQPAGHHQPHHRHWRPPAKLDAVVYHYQVAGVTYQGTWICLCLPIGTIAQGEPGDSVPVHYFPFLPSVAVLRTGPDGYLIGGLGLFGIALLMVAPAWRGMLRAARRRSEPWQNR